jgi:hypothetical protein
MPFKGQSAPYMAIPSLMIFKTGRGRFAHAGLVAQAAVNRVGSGRVRGAKYQRSDFVFGPGCQGLRRVAVRRTLDSQAQRQRIAQMPFKGRSAP